jgi:hypothetical protein
MMSMTSSKQWIHFRLWLRCPPTSIWGRCYKAGINFTKLHFGRDNFYRSFTGQFSSKVTEKKYLAVLGAIIGFDDP